MRRLLLLLSLLLPQMVAAQYQPPTDSLVLSKLRRWQDLKFGIIFHWGLYSVPGIVESWQLTSEDWITPDPVMSYDEYKRWYWGLIDRFNPTQFDPCQWARVSRRAGARYMVFTSKHHDGFCLFDSRETDFTVTHSRFSDNPRADVLRHVFDAFRAEGLMIGCYYSKPDWHSPYYWWPARATGDRHHNYSISQYPDRWHLYQQFVYNQSRELMQGYGPIDIFWLDGGWCTAPHEDIRLDSIVAMAREAQPGLIVVERSCPGPFEDYQTPEQRVPDRQITTPWESCITLTDDWGWTSHPRYKPVSRVIATLAEIVAKGGSLLLGIGPTPEGVIDEGDVARLDSIGRWLDTNGQAIYSTVPTPIYSNNEANVWFTADRDGHTMYAIVLPVHGAMPSSVTWQGNTPHGRITLLATGERVRYATAHGETTVSLPRGLREAVALRFDVGTPEPLYKNPLMPVDERVDDLLGRMTLAEKVGQLQCPFGWPMYDRHGNQATFNDTFRSAMDQAPIGAMWGLMRADPWTRRTHDTGLNPLMAVRLTNAMQRYAVEHTRLGIPILFAEECPHGHMAIEATTFPTGLAQASTWNDSLLTEMGRVIGREALAQGARVAYGPVLDIARDARWSRVEETMGEDTYLVGRLGAAVVRGVQSAGDGRSLICTLKHLAAYGVPEAGLNAGAANIGWRQVESDYLPQFQAAVNAGAASVMSSYNSIDGTPCTANRYLLTDVLRGRWQFHGLVFSDLHSIEGIKNDHHCAADYAEAAAIALRAGVDIDLEGRAYEYLPEALERGLCTIADIDTAVRRVLTVKMRMGLFDNPYIDERNVACVNDQHARHLARQVAREGIVLLANDGTLPLSRHIRRLAVIGPNADNVYNQLGDYTAPQLRHKVVTVLDGLRRALPHTEVVYVKGCDIRDTLHTDIQAAVSAARQADAVVLVLGGSSARDFKTQYISTGAAIAAESTISDMDCGEGYDRCTLDLLGDQERLLQALAATGTPLVTVYIEGRPLLMNTALQVSNALLTAWYPGEQGGAAVADVLVGDSNPAGRLPVSIPRSVGQLPVYYAQTRAHDYVEQPSSPLFPFGYGLSYTTFSYDDIQVAHETDSLVVTLTVTNTGAVDGDEVVQLYLSDHSSPITPQIDKEARLPSLAPGGSFILSSAGTDRKLLRAFSRIHLRAGESRRLRLVVRE